MYEYFIRHSDRFGNVKSARIKPLDFSASSRLYGGTFSFSISASDAVAANLATLDVFEIYIRNRKLGIVSSDSSAGVLNGFVFFNEYFLYDFSMQDDTRSVGTISCICYDKWNILDWRAILWSEETEDRTSFTGVASETVAKTLVRYNATSFATVSNGRWREGDVLPMGVSLSVAYDSGRGAVIDRKTRGGKLLGVIRDVQQNSGGHFVLKRTGYLAYTFDYNETYQGRDLTDSVIFSTNRKTMAQPKFESRFSGSATVAVGAGQRQGNDRAISNAVESENYSDELDVEQYFDIQQIDRPTALDAEVANRLYAERPQQKFSFKALQTSDTFYSPIQIATKNSYNVGDGVTAIYQGLQFTMMISGVTLTAQAHGLDVSVDLENQENA